MAFSKIVNQLISIQANASDEDNFALENDINFMVYKLYDFTYDEVLTIDPKTTITQQQYEL